MPKIERSVAYTFDAYSGGLIEDMSSVKSTHSNRRNSQVSYSLLSKIRKEIDSYIDEK